MKRYTLILCLLLVSLTTFAQENKKSELYKTIISKDDLLFNIGFNTCDISQFDNLLSEKFEFFHDKDGISDKKEFVYNLRHSLCNSPATYQSRRELVEDSTEIYPLYKSSVLYGAVQTGTHQFYEKVSGKAETLRALRNLPTFGFWKTISGNWREVLVTIIKREKEQCVSQ